MLVFVGSMIASTIDPILLPVSIIVGALVGSLNAAVMGWIVTAGAMVVIRLTASGRPLDVRDDPVGGLIVVTTICSAGALIFITYGIKKWRQSSM